MVPIDARVYQVDSTARGAKAKLGAITFAVGGGSGGAGGGSNCWPCRSLRQVWLAAGEHSPRAASAAMPRRWANRGRRQVRPTLQRDAQRRSLCRGRRAVVRAGTIALTHNKATTVMISRARCMRGRQAISASARRTTAPYRGEKLPTIRAVGNGNPPKMGGRKSTALTAKNAARCQHHSDDFASLYQSDLQENVAVSR